ncbi:C-C chemokine receptor-like 2 [Rhynchocyon petersi]
MDNYTSSAPVNDDYYDVFIEDIPNNDGIEQCEKYEATILSTQLVPALFSTVFLVCLLDNLLLVLVLVKHKGLRHTENVYFLNLAISNLLFSLSLPLWASTASPGGILGDPMCKLLVVFYTIGLYSEVCFNMLLVVHRYMVFSCRPRVSCATKTGASSIITSVLMWTVAVLVTLPETTVYRPQREGPERKCSLSRPHFLSVDENVWNHFLTLKLNILGFLFPLFTFLICYVPLRKTLWCGESKDGLHRLIFAILGVFLVMWAPYNITLFLWTFQEDFSLDDCSSRYSLDRGVLVAKLIATVHCCVNPLLHGAFNQPVRKCLCHLLQGGCCSAQHSVNSEGDPAREQPQQCSRV